MKTLSLGKTGSGRSMRAMVEADQSQNAKRYLWSAARSAIESLEARRMLSVVTVNSTADTDTRDANLTLREAIEVIDGTLTYSSLSTQEKAQINLTQPLGTNDTIKFNISGTGLQTFYPQTAIPAITKAVTIDGYSQPGATAATSSAAPSFKVAMDGVYAANTSALVVEAPNVTIDGLLIYRFTGSTDGGDGIDLSTGSGTDAVWGNYLGTDGTRSLGNDVGIDVEHGSSNDTIGGTDAAHRNVISANLDIGIVINGSVFEDARSGGNVIEGNYIGTNAAGTAAIANGTGIAMSRTLSTTIGGTTAGAGNVISGNTDYGIEASYYGQDTAIEGNFIGTNAAGSAAVGNGYDGVIISVSPGCTIGSAVAGGGNVISGNGSDGIHVSGGPAAMIVNNFIGTDVLGKTAIPNKQDGIDLSGENAVTIGGTDANTRNLISGNVNGIELGGSSDDIVEGNYIGTDVTGTTALGNTGSGVLVDGDGASNNETIGGTTAAARNVISGNGAFGVAIEGSTDDSQGDDANSIVVEGNYIGTDVTGEKALGDGNAGVYMDLGTLDNTIGGTASGAGNLISGIAGAGVYISGTHIDYEGGTQQVTTTYSNTVQGNLIGTDAMGTKSLIYYPTSTDEPFDGDGIYLDEGTYDNTIGGTTAADRNVISGNMAVGIHLDDSGTSNVIEGNYVGVDVTGAKALGNGHYGIDLADGSNNNIIGGTTAGAGNVISANGTSASYAGVEIYRSTGNTVQGNNIGTDATGTVALGNTGAGVFLEFNSSDNTIGGNSAAVGNVIANNGGAGVGVLQYSSAYSGGAGTPQSIGNTIRFNSIFSNTGLGIDLENDGVTANDPKDPDTGGNDLQNYPVLATATATASAVTVAGTFNSLPSTNFILDFFANATVNAHGNSQGRLYIGSVTVSTDTAGNATFNSTFSTAIGGNTYITATATNQSTAPYGDTSEFSAPITATGNTVVAPAINSFTVDTGTTQRSRVRTLTLVFTQQVTLDSGAIVLTKTGTSTPLTYTTSTADGGITYVITPTSGTSSGSLTDGNYTLTVVPTGVHAASNSSVTMTGSNQTYKFFRLFGDSNGDGTVNLVDYRAFAASYLKSTGSAGYNFAFDTNNDGTINLIDYRAFAANYLKSITT